MDTQARLGLFEGYGVELEYMIVDAQTLDLRPICDQLFERAGAPASSDVERGDIAWSNELVMHVVELKTNGPAKSLDDIATQMMINVAEINDHLAEDGAMLLPTAMHPWMLPGESKLWPHEYTEVYRAYDRIFDCRGHGWSNLQSTHINLPFKNDEEFGKLHAAIRMVLPLIPALAASSPYVEGTPANSRDARLSYYMVNQQRIPSISGLIIPEPVYTENDYHEQILKNTYRDIAPHDPDGVLQYEFLNSRGAIGRFTRGAIEIRLIDIQECPTADLAILKFIVALLKDIIFGDETRLAVAYAYRTEELATLLRSAIIDAEHTAEIPAAYKEFFGTESAANLGELLQNVYTRLVSEGKIEPQPALELIFQQGTLATRLLHRWPMDRNAMRSLYRRLAECLEENIQFSVR